MGELAGDIAVEGADGQYGAMLSKDWEMWGPLGGYVAAIALNAVSQESAHPRPLSFSCHYLAVPEFGAVDVAVRTMRDGKRAASHRVVITQGDGVVLEAAVWSVPEGEGPDHVATAPPPMPRPPELVRLSEERQAAFPFLRNFLAQAVPFDVPTAAWRSWAAFQPVSTYDDPWIDACRSLILLDLSSWIAAVAPHSGLETPYVAPSLDLNVTFQADARSSDWLFIDTSAPFSRAGAFGWQGHTWTDDGQLAASAVGTNVWRKMKL